MNMIENDLTEKQADFQSALNEQFDVLRYDRLNNGLVRFVCAPLEDLDVELETIHLNNGAGTVAREQLIINVRIKGFVVDQSGILLELQDMSNKDNEDGSPQWLRLDYTNSDLEKLQAGLR